MAGARRDLVDELARYIVEGTGFVGVAIALAWAIKRVLLQDGEWRDIVEAKDAEIVRLTRALAYERAEVDRLRGNHQ